jgi:hypothetical protein
MFKTSKPESYGTPGMIRTCDLLIRSVAASVSILCLSTTSSFLLGFHAPIVGKVVVSVHNVTKRADPFGSHDVVTTVVFCNVGSDK